MTTLPNKALNLFDGTRTIVSGFVGMLEGIFTDTVTRLAPILAPLPPAFSVYTAMAKAETPFWVALCTALAVELIGIFSSKVAVRSWNWNRTRLKTEPAAPFRLTVAMAAIYFIVVLILALSIEIWTESLIILYPGFVIIAAATYVSNAISGDLSAWQRERDERLRQQREKRGLSAEIKALKETLTGITGQRETLAAEVTNLQKEKATLTKHIKALKARSKTESNATADKRPATTTQKTVDLAREILTEVWQDGQEISGSELGRRLGRSGSLGRNLKKQLWGEITTPNGTTKINGEVNHN